MSDIWRATGRVAAVTTLLLASASCVTTPQNGESVANTASPVIFEGYGLTPLRRVYVEAGSSSSGPFTLVPGAASFTELLPSQTVPVGLGVSLPLYAFELSSAIPAARWQLTTDADGCSLARTFVRVRDALGTYRTFDADSPGFACVQAQLTAGNSPQEAFELCGSDQSPVIRLSAGTRFVGDVVIDDASDVLALRCIEEIDGSLTVLASAPNLVSLPRLARITGNVELLYNSYRPEPDPMSSYYEALRCGGMHAVTADTRVYDVPALARVDGNLTLRQQGTFSGISTQPIELGLASITSLGGSLTIEIGQFGGSPCGLPALSKVPGDLAVVFVHFGEIDSSINGLLTTLGEVGGAFTFQGGHNTFGNPMPMLAKVGALHILKNSPTLSGFHFPALADVTGVAELAGTGPGSNLTGLLRAGSLWVHDSGYTSLEQVGGASLLLGGLELVDNDTLGALRDGTGASKVTLQPAAKLTVLDNGALSSAETCAFVAVQAAKGWSGASDLGGVSCP